MAAATQRPELLVIVGPTASGKSALALRVAKQFNGEVITADSRTVYKGMNIGTAKPTLKEWSAVPHWGLDLVAPGESYSAYRFKGYALKKIGQIEARGRLPIITGGTGLYVDSVIFDFQFGPPADPALREKLQAMSVEQLQALIRADNYPMPANQLNKRHLIRTIETDGAPPRQGPLRPGSLLIGLNPSDETLKKRINERVEQMFKTGFIEEVERLLNEYGEDKIIKSSGIGYGPAISYLKGEINQAEAKRLFKSGDWQYARRQRTWFRRNPFIHWLADGNSAFTEINKLLNK